MILRREGIHDACRWIKAMCVQGVNGGSEECCTWNLGDGGTDPLAGCLVEADGMGKTVNWSNLECEGEVNTNDTPFRSSIWQLSHFSIRFIFLPGVTAQTNSICDTLTHEMPFAMR